MSDHGLFGKATYGLLIPLLALLWPGWAAAADDDKRGLAFATLGLAPYSFLNADQQPVGTHYDMLNMIQDRLGWPRDNRRLSTKRLLKEMILGRIDCSILARTPVTVENNHMDRQYGYQPGFRRYRTGGKRSGNI